MAIKYGYFAGERFEVGDLIAVDRATGKIMKWRGGVTLGYVKVELDPGDMLIIGEDGKQFRSVPGPLPLPPGAKAMPEADYRRIMDKMEKK